MLSVKVGHYARAEPNFLNLNTSSEQSHLTTNVENEGLILLPGYYGPDYGVK